MRDLILGIETSCDDTGVALVDSLGTVHAAALASQIELHDKFGGVYPQVASRAHLQNILPTVSTVIDDCGVDPREIRAIGVTRGPGLIGSLMVGVDTARALGAGWGVPVIGVNHLRGHLRSADLEGQRVTFPAVLLLVSGGHTILAHMPDRHTVVLLGETVDDSLGEAYDKVARMLGLSYPGGPVIDRLAKAGVPRHEFPRPMLTTGLNFSFSGLKTAVRYFLERSTDYRPEDVAASFVASCLDVLSTKCERALDSLSGSDVRSLAVVGGVAASPQVRMAMGDLCAKRDVALCLPPLRWSTDNGAMIALAAWDYLDQNSGSLQPDSGLRLDVV